MRCLLAIVAVTTLAWLDFLPSLPVVSGGLPEEGKPNGSAVEAQAYLPRMTGISEDKSSRRGTGSNARAKIRSNLYGVMRRLMRASTSGYYQWWLAPLTAAVVIIFARAMQARCSQYFSNKHDSKTVGRAQRRLAGNDEELASLCEGVNNPEHSSDMLNTKSELGINQRRGDPTERRTKPETVLAGVFFVGLTTAILYLLMRFVILSDFPNATNPVPSEETQTSAASSPVTSTVQAQSSPTTTTEQAQSAGDRKRRDVSDDDLSSSFLTKDEAEALALDNASKIIKQLNEKSTDKKPMRTALKEAAKTIVSKNGEDIISVEVIGGRGRKAKKSSGHFSTKPWIQHSGDYLTRQASATVKEGRYSVTVKVKYAGRAKPVVEPLLNPSPTVDSAGKRPEQRPSKRFSTDMGLSDDEATDFMFDIATAVAKDLKNGQYSQEEISSRVALWTEGIVSKNSDLGFELMIRAGRAPEGLNLGPQIGTPVWKDHRRSSRTELFSGTAVDEPYRVQVYLEVLQRPAPRQKVPSLGMKTELPPFLDDSVADAFAKNTADFIAHRLEQEKASPSFINAALEKWTDEITSQHKGSYFNLRIMGSSGTAIKISETYSPTQEWLWDRPTTKKTANAQGQAGKYSVNVYVDYADNSD